MQAVTDVVQYKLAFAEIEQGRPATVKDAAMAFKDICYEYRDEIIPICQARSVLVLQIWIFFVFVGFQKSKPVSGRVSDPDPRKEIPPVC